RNHDEYGQLIDVPAFDLMTEEADQLHLWYLIENPAILANCLRKRITRWEQLKNFLDSGGKIESIDQELITEAEQKVHLLRHYQTFYRKGRPYPIDRSVLEDSGAVSDKFINEVSQKLKENSENPEKLLESLKNGEVKRFAKNKIEELEEYLKDKEYLPREELMDEENINTQLQAYISQSDLDAKVAENFMKKLSP
ncbi:MAG: hypothetical protein ABEH43_09875, partial [Flavobacteriales bacterium]